MPFHPVRSEPLSFHVPQYVDPLGLRGPTRHQARRGRWLRTSTAQYVPAGTDLARVEQRVVNLAARYAGSVVSGWGALWFHGAAYFDGLGPDRTTTRPLVLVLPHSSGRRRSPEVRLSYEPLINDEEVAEVEGIRVATPVRALFDEVRISDPREGVVALDMAAAERLVAPEHLSSYLEERTGWRRSSLVPGVVGLASELSRSPNETRLRLIWVLDAGLPAALVNREVFTRDGQLICIADLFDPVAGMVVEFDGSEHRRTRRHASDVARQERCREAGLEYTVVTGTDLADRALVVDRLRSARARASFADPSTTRWTLEAPPHWSVSTTWADERAHAAWLSEQLELERPLSGGRG